VSDDAFSLPSTPPPIMSPEKARDIGRAHKGWANYLSSQGLSAEARQAEQSAQWWLTYSITLTQTKTEGA